MILDDRYGGKEVAIMTAMHRLMQLKISSGPTNKKIEALTAEIQTAKRCLIAVGQNPKYSQAVS